MKNLSSYIKENNQVELVDYIEINEGLLSFFKKMWNHMFNSIEKNKKEHGGHYKPYDFVLKALGNKTSDKTTSDNKLDTVLLTGKKFKKWLQSFGPLNKKHPFRSLWDFYNEHKGGVNNQKIKIFCLTIKDKDEKYVDFISVLFGRYDKDKKSITLLKDFWNEKLPITDEYKKSFLEYCKIEIPKLFGKQSITTVNIECKD